MGNGASTDLPGFGNLGGLRVSHKGVLPEHPLMRSFRSSFYKMTTQVPQGGYIAAPDNGVKN